MRAKETTKAIIVCVKSRGMERSFFSRKRDVERSQSSNWRPIDF